VFHGRYVVKVNLQGWLELVVVWGAEGVEGERAVVANTENTMATVNTETKARSNASLTMKTREVLVEAMLAKAKV
jgi:hypothetical protein